MDDWAHPYINSPNTRCFPVWDKHFDADYTFDLCKFGIKINQSGFPGLYVLCKKLPRIQVLMNRDDFFFPVKLRTNNLSSFQASQVASQILSVDTQWKNYKTQPRQRLWIKPSCYEVRNFSLYLAVDSKDKKKGRSEEASQNVKPDLEQILKTQSNGWFNLLENSESIISTSFCTSRCLHTI